ncbi:hypothetical protein [Phormidium sp. CCY1219]|nr:hypothetical protein [Phormidium sp. CCY1219]MEB3831836.1 hypothetical protein [Phormidium sp. CCY1219]
MILSQIPPQAASAIAFFIFPLTLSPHEARSPSFAPLLNPVVSPSLA